MQPRSTTVRNSDPSLPVDRRCRPYRWGALGPTATGRVVRSGWGPAHIPSSFRLPFLSIRVVPAVIHGLLSYSSCPARAARTVREETPTTATTHALESTASTTPAYHRPTRATPWTPSPPRNLFLRLAARALLGASHEL